MAEALLKVFFLAFLPISEIRGALPYGVWGAGLPFFLVLGVALCGNLLSYFVVMYTLHFFLVLFLRFRWFQNWWTHYTTRVRERFRKYAQWEKWGVLLFIGIPLPFTGVWTGSLICFLGGLSFRESFPFVLGGLLMASCIVSVLTLLGKAWIF